MRRLGAALAAFPAAQPTRLVMDEFALYKSHRYATVLLNANTWRVLGIGEGHSRAVMRPIFERLWVQDVPAARPSRWILNTAFR